MISRAEILERITPKECYMGNVKTLNTFHGLRMAEIFIKEKGLNISTSFGNKSFEKPKGAIVDCGYVYEIKDDDVEAYQLGLEFLTDNGVVYPFVEKPCPTEELRYSMHIKTAYKIIKKLPLNKEEESFILEKSEFLREGYMKLGGFIINISSYLETYWVKYDGDITEYKMMNENILKKYIKEYYGIKKPQIVKVGA